MTLLPQAFTCPHQRLQFIANIFDQKCRHR
jgi:hypothetical protein